MCKQDTPCSKTNDFTKGYALRIKVPLKVTAMSNSFKTLSLEAADFIYSVDGDPNYRSAVR